MSDSDNQHQPDSNPPSINALDCLQFKPDFSPPLPFHTSITIAKKRYHYSSSSEPSSE